MFQPSPPGGATVFICMFGLIGFFFRLDVPPAYALATCTFDSSCHFSSAVGLTFNLTQIRPKLFSPQCQMPNLLFEQMTPHSHLYNVFTVKVIILKADFFLNELELHNLSSFKTKTNHTRGTKCTVRMRLWIIYQTEK